MYLVVLVVCYMYGSITFTHITVLPLLIYHYLSTIVKLTNEVSKFYWSICTRKKNDTRQ